MAKRTKCDTNVPECINNAMVNECIKCGMSEEDAKNWLNTYWVSGCEVVATRSAFEWFGILLKYNEKGQDRIFYIDFVGFGNKAENWSLLNDSEDVESIDEFLNAPDIAP